MNLSKTTVVIGSQWGDEGKGKIVDFLSAKSDFIVRFHGGNNAGHTVVNSLGTFKMHLIPCGVFYPGTKLVITHGVVIDPLTLIKEIKTLEKSGVSLENRLFISPRAHIIMPYHRLLDSLYEKNKGKNKTGTTGRGIGPVYADKVSYMGIRLEDLVSPAVFKEKIALYLPIKNKIIKALGGKPLSFSKILKEYTLYARALKKYVTEPYFVLAEAAGKGKRILYEGAHGILLDNDWGTYPFVTASSVLPDISGKSSVIGIVKAYSTRVGEGPLPTEQANGIGEKLRKIGDEYGSTTGRPRRCGWFDAALVRFAARVGGFTGIALTKLDVLSDFKTIKVSVGYRGNGKNQGISGLDLKKAKPVYRTFKGWGKSLDNITSYKNLPTEAKKYIEFIESFVQVPVKYISTGPSRSALINR